ncbi:unnamed protein product, partial [Closterium sp. NIES-54]
MQVLALASTSYKVQSLALSPVPSPALPADNPRGTTAGSSAGGGGGGGGTGAGGVGGKGGGKSSRAGVTALESSAPPLGGGQWSTLQMELLSDMLAVAVRAGEPLAAWAAAARLLRGFYPLILPHSQVWPSSLGCTWPYSATCWSLLRARASPLLPGLLRRSFCEASTLSFCRRA